MIAEGTVSGPEYELSRDREMDTHISSTDLPRHDQYRINEAVDFDVENLGKYRFRYRLSPAISIPTTRSIGPRRGRRRVCSRGP